MESICFKPVRIDDSSLNSSTGARARLFRLSSRSIKASPSRRAYNQK